MNWGDVVVECVFMLGLALMVWAINRPRVVTKIVTVDLDDERRQRERVKHLTIPIEKLEEKDL